MLDCLYAECTPCITDCVLAELEKLGQKYRVALKVAKVSAPRRYQTHQRSRGCLRQASGSAAACRSGCRGNPAQRRGVRRCAPLLMRRRRRLQDPRIERLPCSHSGTYADDCICERVRQHKCYIVATCDRDLRRRIRKVG
jgi:rRNA-processing protein FCF1